MFRKRAILMGILLVLLAGILLLSTVLPLMALFRSEGLASGVVLRLILAISLAPGIA